MPITPTELLNKLTPEIEEAISETVSHIDRQLTTKFYGQSITVNCVMPKLPIPTELYIQKIEQLYRQADWKIVGEKQANDWIKFTMEPYSDK